MLIIGYVPPVVTERELYTELSNILQFPSYFGKDWDARIYQNCLTLV